MRWCKTLINTVPLMGTVELKSETIEWWWWWWWFRARWGRGLSVITPASVWPRCALVTGGSCEPRNRAPTTMTRLHRGIHGRTRPRLQPVGLVFVKNALLKLKPSLVPCRLSACVCVSVVPIDTQYWYYQYFWCLVEMLKSRMLKSVIYCHYLLSHTFSFFLF